MSIASIRSRALRLAAALGLAAALAGCGYNDFQRLDEEVKAGWSEVLNQYQRRADLIPNIVATVKGEANFEQETLTRVVEARAKATSIQVTPETLKGFQDLRVQLEGTENRITVARNRYIKTVQEYNVLARSFPSNLTAMVFSYEVKPSFTVQNEAAISAPPAVSFERPAAPAASR